MTEDDKALVKRMDETLLEWERREPRDDWWSDQHDYASARDLIEQQAASIAKLEEALRWIVNHTDDVSVHHITARAALEGKQ